MPLPVPQLDDRDYQQLLAEAKALIPTHAPEWTDLSPGDPGVTLLELMAYLTDAMLYRLNRIPDKVFVQFLNLVGITLTPPAAASVELTFTVTKPAIAPIMIKRGTRVTTTRPGGPVFTTVSEAVIGAGELAATAVALHCDLHPGEDLGTGTGQGGQRVRVSSAPIVLDSGDGADLLVGVEVLPTERDQRVSVIKHGAVSYRLWTPVQQFGSELGDGYVYIADRAEGMIIFSPYGPDLQFGEGLQRAQVPAVGRQIRAWYRSGGGAAGNVNAGTLTVLKDPIASSGAGNVAVVNPAPATGGRDLERLADALLRGPQQVNSFDRVVTARDYERVAVGSSGGVSRALAVTSAALWAGAPPGQVQVLLVPSVDDHEVLTAGPDELTARQSPLVVERVAAALAEQQPIGVTSQVGWAGLKGFHVEAQAVIHRAEDRETVRSRLDQRLREALTPLPWDGSPGWGFGEPLRASTVYDVLLAERGVRYVESVRLVVDTVPGDVTALIADPHADRTWFCASDGHVFRSTDDAEGWELVADVEGEKFESLSSARGRPGLVVAAARVGQTEASRIHVSADYGETWSVPAEFSFHVEDVSAAAAGGRTWLFFATDSGLFRLDLADGSVPEAILVEAAQPAKPFYAVEVVSDPQNELQVAVAAQELGGVYLSFQGGRAGTYQPLGMQGVDVRLLRVQRTPGRRFLLTGAFATGDEAGAGVNRLELLPYQVSPAGWRAVGATWVGGSCRDLATIGDRIYAATARSAITASDTGTDGTAWRAAAVDCGLPLREVGRFQPLFSVATAGGRLLAGCIGGVYASSDARTWAHASPAAFAERISLPRTWLFAPGEHHLNVRYDDARG